MSTSTLDDLHYVHVHFNTIAGLFSEFALLINSMFDSSILPTLRSSGYYLPFNEYPYYGRLQYPPSYPQQSFPSPFLPKQLYPPHVLHPLVFPTNSSPPGHSSLRVERQMSNPHTRAATLKKLRRTSTKQPPAFSTSGVLSSVQLARGKPHGWRPGYKSPSSKSYFRTHFDILTSKLNHKFF